MSSPLDMLYLRTFEAIHGEKFVTKEMVWISPEDQKKHIKLDVQIRELLPHRWLLKAWM